MKSPLFFYTLLAGCLALALPSGAQSRAVTDTIETPKAGVVAHNDSLYFEAVKAKMHNDDKVARDLFEQYSAKNPNSSAGWYELAKIYYVNKDRTRAEEYIKKAIALDPANKWFKEEYATILADRGDYLQAANIAAELSELDPRDREYPLMAADYYEKAKKYQEALSFIDKALLRNGAEEDILMRKMQLYLQMNNVDKAADVIKSMIASDPKNGKYYKLLGDLYDNNKLPGKAAEVYETAQKKLPGDPSIQLGLAEHYLKAGDTTAYIGYVKKIIVNNELDAETQLEFLSAYIQSLPNDSTLRSQGLPMIRQIIAQHPKDADVQEIYGEFQELNNQHDSAVAAYKKSLELKPSNYKLWERLLNSLAGSRNDADTLIRYSEKAMRLFPNQAAVHYYNGIAHYNKKEYEAAVKAVNRAIDMEPETEKQLLSSMYELLGEIYHADKKDNLSDEAYEKALRLAPYDPYILNNYSYYLSVRGQKLDEAEKMSKKSLELKPKEATFMDTYGWILFKKGNYEKAREYIQQAIDIAGAKADATLYEHLGDIFFKLNNKDNAVKNWKIAKQKGGDSPQLDKKISEQKLYE
jgi:tetratricopeptide (TPR) repeat protein